METATGEIAKHLRGVYFGGNWTSVNLKDTLSGIAWQDAITKVGTCNTIAVLLFHTSYYVNAILQVLKGLPLDAHDSLSFDLPPISSSEAWESLLNHCLLQAEELALLVEQLPLEKLGENFAGEKYGSYYRNLNGLIEHTHYHLGQMVIIKKLLAERNTIGNK